MHNNIHNSPHNSLHNLHPIVGCRCTYCPQVKSECQEIKKILKEMNTKKVQEVSTHENSVKPVNLCNQEISEKMEKSINYTYTDYGRQLMILDCKPPVS